MTIWNQNGNFLVLANKHKDNRDPKNWKGFTFAVPFEQSHQTLQLRNYLAAAGLDPDQDVKYRIVPPTEYVASLRVGSIDGFFGGEPGGQRTVYEGAGFIHLISKDIWDGHPCCSVTAAESWIQQNPNTFMAFYRAIIASSLRVSKPENRVGMAKVLSEPQYLNAPEIVLEQVVSGTYADGLGTRPAQATPRSRSHRHRAAFGLHHRAIRRVGRSSDANECKARRKRVVPQWLESVDHQRR